MPLAALKFDDTSEDMEVNVANVYRPVPDFTAVADLFRSRVGHSLIAEKYLNSEQSQNSESMRATANVESEIVALKRRVNDAVRAPFVRPPQLPRLSLEPLQEWEGVVSLIDKDAFTARLVDVTAGNTSETEVGKFPLADLSETELLLLKEGAVFRWVIGYLRAPSGSKRRTSQIIFRRMPAWSRKEISDAQAKAESLLDGITWD